MATQVNNGRAFEFAVAQHLARHFCHYGSVKFVIDNEYDKCRKCYEMQLESEKQRYLNAAISLMDKFYRLEPGLSCPKSVYDVLYIRLLPDSVAKFGDPRDIQLYRLDEKNKKQIAWEVGFSAKNNHEAVKNPRISPTRDFGRAWLDMPCSAEYFQDVKNVFSWVGQTGATTWEELGEEKFKKVYKPIMVAFKRQLDNFFRCSPNLAAERLIRYLAGSRSFYKIIKNDRDSTVDVKAFAFFEDLNRSYNEAVPEARVKKIPLPTKVLEFDFIPGSYDTMSMVLDGGWRIDFRIHNADKIIKAKAESNSLKLDVQLKGNPPNLFSKKFG